MHGRKELNKNNMLEALRPDDKKYLMDHMRLMDVVSNQVLYEPGDVVQHTYFPLDATLVSFMVMLQEGRGVETVMVGREGAIGGIVSHGQIPAYCRSIVLFPGKMLTIETAKLEEIKMERLHIRHFFARYSDCLLAQIFQSVACNAAHSIEQRTAKWLLATIDRTGEQNIALTQDQLANLLGVGRSYVTRVISRMKRQNVLQTARGRLIVEDIKRMQKISCNCNNQVQAHFNEVMAGVYPAGDH